MIPETSPQARRHIRPEVLFRAIAESLRMPTKLTILLIGALALNGCATPGEISSEEAGVTIANYEKTFGKSILEALEEQYDYCLGPTNYNPIVDPNGDSNQVGVVVANDEDDRYFGLLPHGDSGRALSFTIKDDGVIVPYPGDEYTIASLKAMGCEID